MTAYRIIIIVRLLQGFECNWVCFVILKAQLKMEDTWFRIIIRLDTRHYIFTREEKLEDLNWLLMNEKEQWEKYYVGNIEPPTLLPEI